MICEECMQFSPNCFCVTHQLGIRYVEQVSGCIHFSKSHKRCKAPRNIINNNELYVCKKHTIEIPDKYQKILDSYSEKNKN